MSERIPLKYRLQWFYERHMEKLPWITNEGEATAKLIDRELSGYPSLKDFDDLESAVQKLQDIWNLLDDWGDGRRINVLRAKRAGYFRRGKRKKRPRR